jgi:hypothetical protein
MRTKMNKYDYIYSVLRIHMEQLPKMSLDFSKKLRALINCYTVNDSCSGSARALQTLLAFLRLVCVAHSQRHSRLCWTEAFTLLTLFARARIIVMLTKMGICICSFVSCMNQSRLTTVTMRKLLKGTTLFPRGTGTMLLHSSSPEFLPPWGLGRPDLHAEL